MRDIFENHIHVFDDCKCCGLNHVCDCGFTQYELSLEKDLAQRDEDVRRLKAQMKERHKDYAKTISDLAGQLSALWLQLGCEGGMIGGQENKEIEKENEK